MNFLNDKVAGYEVFLPAITADYRKKKKTDDNLTDSEFKAVVAVVFRDAVLRFIRDSKLYRAEIPIDVYAGVTRYDVIPPDGYYIDTGIRLRTGAANLPAKYTFTDTEIQLYDCCPEKSVDKAWYAEVSLVPLRTSGVCTFSQRFLDIYYEAIIACMHWQFSMMTERQWHQLGTTQYHEKKYLTEKNRAVVGGTDSSKAAKLKYRRLSDGTC